MGTIASQENPDSRTPSEEGGARAAILDAARILAEREGVLEMTLTGVAKEARLAASDIYAFFTSKNDLLQAVVADDLAGLAKTMRRSLERQPDGPDAAAVAHANAIPLQIVAADAEHTPEAATTAEDSVHAETPVAPTQAAEMPEPEAYMPETPAPAPTVQTPRRFPVVQARRESSRADTPEADAATAKAIARLQEQVAKLESRPVDQWLERRLREFERALGSLQHSQSERTASNDSHEQTLQGLRDSIEALDMRHAMAADEAARAANERFDGIDRHLRETASDVQAEAAHLARRITALENLAFAARPDMMPAAAAFEPVAAPAQAAMLEEPHEAPGATDEPSHDSADAAPSYLAAARRSAQVAAAEANEEARRNAGQRKPNRTLLYAACGSLAVFVLLLAGAGLVLRNASMNPQPVQTAAQAVRAHARPAAAKQWARALPHAQTAGRATPPNLPKLAQAGDPAAELLVGLNYLDGRGVPKNEAAAVDWLSRSAAQGQPVAQYDLGALYADGRGVHADAVQAFQWFGAAALRGNRRAMHFLAIAYAEGVGTAKNLPEAARWFERAAALGAVNSQFNLAILYERGLGVSQNLVTAYTWYAIAAAQGDHEAEARVTALAATLKPAELSAAKSAADAFRPEPLDATANFAPKLPS